MLMQEFIYEINCTLYWVEEISSPTKQLIAHTYLEFLFQDLISLEESFFSLHQLYSRKITSSAVKWQDSLLFYSHQPLKEKKEPYYANGLVISLPMQIVNTVALTKVTLWGLWKNYRSGYKYQKADECGQCTLFGSAPVDGPVN